MLQQTQVPVVAEYFARFVERFPDVESLADADLDPVLALWSGLGYYARARNLHKTAQIICREFKGRFPDNTASLQTLPGIGRSTAGAILSTALGVRAPILDGNVKRVLARHAGIEGWPGRSKVARRLWDVAEIRTPVKDFSRYTQAIMDLGASLCTRDRPDCRRCPVSTDCVAFAEGRTKELPTRKQTTGPRRNRTTQFLLIVRDGANGQEILLERRPEKGIWGGLYCPPEIEPKEDPSNSLERLGLVVQKRISLPPFDHPFTHYDLKGFPVLLEVASLSGQVNAPDSCTWIAIGELGRIGVPAPLRRLLENREWV